MLADFDDDGGDGGTAVRIEDEGFSKPLSQRRGAGPEDELLDGDDQTQVRSLYWRNKHTVVSWQGFSLTL